MHSEGVLASRSLYDNKTRSCCRGSPECSAGVHLSDLHLY